MCKQKNKRWNWVRFFSFSNETGLLCKTCCEAKVANGFSEGKVWTEWKLEYLKHHIQQKSHLIAVGIVRRCKMGTGIGTLLQESANDREKRNELSCCEEQQAELTFFSKMQPDWDGRTLLCKSKKKLCSQYLKDEKDVQWSDRVKEVMRTSSADARNTGEITFFIRKWSVITWMLVFQRMN